MSISEIKEYIRFSWEKGDPDVAEYYSVNYNINIIIIPKNIKYTESDTNIMLFLDCTKTIDYMFFCIQKNCIIVMKAIIHTYNDNKPLINYTFIRAVEHSRLEMVDYILAVKFLDINILRIALFKAEPIGNKNIIDKIKSKLKNSILFSCFILWNYTKNNIDRKKLDIFLSRNLIYRPILTKILSLYMPPGLFDISNNAENFIKISQHGISPTRDPDLYALQNLSNFLRAYNKFYYNELKILNF